MTKRFLFVLAAMCAVPAITPAIADAQLSAKAGLSFGSVSNGGVLPGTDGQRNGFVVGVGAHTAGPIGIGVEGLYAQRGTSGTHLDYIDVPVYVRLAAPAPMSPVSPFAYVGPQVSFELNCGSDSAICDGSGRKKVTYAGMIGAGATFAAISNISVEARYVYGLTDLKFSTVTTSENYKTRSFMLLAGIGF